MRGRRVGEKEPTPVLYTTQDRHGKRRGEGEIKNPPPHTTHPSAPHLSIPRVPPASPSRTTLLAQTLSRSLSPSHPPLCSLSSGEGGQRAETSEWFNSVRIGFAIERRLMGGGHASKPRVTTTREGRIPTRSILFFSGCPEGGKISHRCRGRSSEYSALPQHTSVGAVPSWDIGWSCVFVRRQSST